MISNTTIARLQRIYETALIDTCTIQQVTVTEGATGRSKSFSTHASNVKCLVTPAPFNRTAIEGLNAASVESMQYITVRIPYNQTIAATDRILTSDGRTLDVITITKRSIQVGTQVLCKQVG